MLTDNNTPQPYHPTLQKLEKALILLDTEVLPYLPARTSVIRISWCGSGNPPECQVLMSTPTEESDEALGKFLEEHAPQFEYEDRSERNPGTFSRYEGIWNLGDVNVRITHLSLYDKEVNDE